MNFCSRCGGRLRETVLETESRQRLVCEQCGHIFYQNPKLVAGAIPVQDGKVIMLRRGIDPRKGFWTFPGGFLEMDETVEEAAIRETKEETNLDVIVTALLDVYTRPGTGIVLVVYLASVLGGTPTVGDEAAEVASFAPSEIPWDLLAFETTEWALRDWVKMLDRPESTA